MLFYETVESGTFSLLKDLSNEETFKEFRLVGGTSLALQIGHRISIDLDFFTAGNRLKHFSLQDLLDFFHTKYQDASSFLLFKSLMYFEDAEDEPSPKMLKSVEWDEIKTSIRSEVKSHFP